MRQAEAAFRRGQAEVRGGDQQKCPDRGDARESEGSVRNAADPS